MVALSAIGGVSRTTPPCPCNCSKMIWKHSERDSGVRLIGSLVAGHVNAPKGRARWNNASGQTVDYLAGAKNDSNNDHCIDDPRPCAGGLNDLGFAWSLFISSRKRQHHGECHHIRVLGRLFFYEVFISQNLATPRLLMGFGPTIQTRGKRCPIGIGVYSG